MSVVIRLGRDPRGVTADYAVGNGSVGTVAVARRVDDGVFVVFESTMNGWIKYRGDIRTLESAKRIADKRARQIGML